MEIEDIQILHKIIDYQSCIIQGRSISAMLHKDKNFYRETTQADMIAIYVNENEKVHLEYILEEHHIFHHLAEKYIFSDRYAIISQVRHNASRSSVAAAFIRLPVPQLFFPAFPAIPPTGHTGS